MNNIGNDFDELYQKMQNTLAEGISKLLRSIETKENRLEGLKRMKPVPSIDSLRRVHKMGIEREDYETCEAIKEFCEFKGLDLKIK